MMSDTELSRWQQSAVELVEHYRHSVVSAGRGAGATYCALYLAHTHAKQGRVVVMLSPYDIDSIQYYHMDRIMERAQRDHIAIRWESQHGQIQRHIYPHGQVLYANSRQDLYQIKGMLPYLIVIDVAHYANPVAINRILGGRAEKTIAFGTYKPYLSSSDEYGQMWFNALFDEMARTPGCGALKVQSKQPQPGIDHMSIVEVQEDERGNTTLHRLESK